MGMERIMLKKKTKYILLLSLTFLLGISSAIQMGSAHSPKFIDLKFYLPEQVLSVYYFHGVSNTSYHYIETVEFEFFNLSTDFDTYIDGLIADGDLINRSYIQEHHVKEEFLIDRVAFNVTYTSQHDDTGDTQDTAIIHHNYTIADYVPTLNVTYWTYIRVTAYSGCDSSSCELGGQFTQVALAGQIWYDIEHSMIEALVPTLVCAAVILAPLATWAIIGKRKQKREINQEVLK